MGSEDSPFLLDSPAARRDPEAPAAAQLDALARDREEELERLDEGEPQAAEERLRLRAAQATDRLEATESASAPFTASLEAMELGSEVRWLAYLGGALSGRPPRDPCAFVEEELDWVEEAAGEHGKWDAAREARARLVLERAAGLREELARRKLARLLAQPAPAPAAPAAERCEQAWLKVGECLELDAALRSAVAGEAKGGAASSEARLEQLEAQRRVWNERARVALGELGPADAAAFLRGRTDALLDQAVVILSEGRAWSEADPLQAVGALRRELGELLELCAAARGSPVAAADAALAAAVRDCERQLRGLRRRARRFELEARVRLRLRLLLRPGGVRALESFVLVLVVGFLGIVAAEWTLPHDSPWRPFVHIADLAFCLFFQADFFLRWCLSGWSGRYFLRHFFLESLPALPYGLIFEHLHAVDAFAELGELRAIVAVRLLSLKGVVLFAARIFRVLAFLVQGSDRAVERFRGALDREVVLFDADPLSLAPASSVARSLLGLEERRRRRARQAYHDVHLEDRCDLLDRCLVVLAEEIQVLTRIRAPYAPSRREQGDEVRLELAVHGLLDCDAALVLSQLGHQGAERVAWWLRLLDVPLVRHAPVWRHFIAAARGLPAPEAVAAAAHVLGEMLQKLLGVLRFWGDLAGISTGPQVLDRIATAFMAATFRPAVRLLLFGAAFLLLQLLIWSVGEGGMLDSAAKSLWIVLVGPLMTVGSLCLVLFLIGRWLKRVAGEALDLYLRTADAHYYSQVKGWKAGHQDQHVEALRRRVFLPEVALRCRGPVEGSELTAFITAGLTGGQGAAVDERLRPLVDDRELVTLTYRDFLDGPILHRTDDRISLQLLGSLFARDVRRQALRQTRREARRLERLDLEKARLLELGPYFWFRFITESLAIETAKLVIDYGTSCLPLDQVAIASPERRRTFEEFLEARRGPWNGGRERRAGRTLSRLGSSVVAGDITALSFLTADPARDEAIRCKYGDEVLRCLRRDRRGVVRDIFGTRPYHLLPRSRRAFNPYRLYRRYLSGLRVFLCPFLWVVWGARVAWFTVSEVARLVLDVLGKEGPGRLQPSREAGFDVAVRKINRMRKPFFLEALRLRAAVDVEYLGLRIPGVERQEAMPTHDGDLDLVGALASERRPIEAMRDAADTDLRRFRQFLADRGWLGDGLSSWLGSLEPSGRLSERRAEVLRALVTAYVTDHGSIRSLMTAGQRARDLCEGWLRARESLLRRVLLGAAAPILWLLPVVRRRRRLLRAYVAAQADLRDLPRRLLRKAFRAFLIAPKADASLLELAQRGSVQEREIVATLAAIAADHAAWTRKIVMVRAVQATAVLDIQSYRDLVWELGEYERG